MNRLMLVLVLLLSHLGSATVLTLSQCSMSGGQWARILVSLQNKGPGSLSKPRVAFDLVVPNGQVPEVQIWDGATVAATVERVSSTSWTVWLTSSTDLADGSAWNDGHGVLFGIHLNDWSNWSAASSPSWSRDSLQLVENTALRVYDAAGRLISTGVPPISSQSSFQIQLDPGGVCNVIGNLVVPVGSSLAVRCQPNVGMYWSGWDIDGLAQLTTKIMDIPADGADHVIRVHFMPRTRFWVSISNSGLGATQPSGDVLAYQGDSVTVAATANVGSGFTRWLVNGVEQGTGPVLTLKNIQATTTVVAEFKLLPPGIGLQVLAREELPRDPKWSKIHLRVRNNGGVNLDAGYHVDYIFRVPKHQTPTLVNWDVPSATTQLIDFGSGYWAVRLTSTASIAVGSEAGDGRGWNFALQTGTAINWDITGNIALPTGTDWANAPLVSVYDRNGVRVAGSDPNLSAAYPDGVQVMALYKEDAGDDKMLRPRVILRNFGDQAISDFIYYWYFQTDSGKVPVVTPWFLNGNIPALEALGNGHYRLRYDYTDSTLPPHTDLPTPDGSVSGIYLPGFPSWNKSTACSYLPGSVFQPDSAVLVYGQNGKLLWGKLDAIKACGGDTGKVVDSIEWIAYPPVIVVQPRDSNVREGESVRFEARATGEGTLRYQWRWNGADIVGATGSILDLSRVVGDQDGDEFSCAISNSAGTTLSRKARLGVSVIPQPAYILLQPQDDTVSLGSDATFRVLVLGGENLRYQWLHDGKTMPSQTGSRLVLRGVMARDSGRYEVRIFLANGKTLVSRKASLVLVPQQPTSMVISVSGTFVDTLKSTSPDTTADLIVRLFTSPQDGNPVWSEQHSGVPIRNGDWNLAIGKVRQSPSLSEVASRYAGLYLEVALDGVVPVVFGPRVPLTSVPYASSAGARVIYGQGAPVQPALEGVLYLDQIDQRLWQRKGSAWNRLDP